MYRIRSSGRGTRRKIAAAALVAATAALSSCGMFADSPTLDATEENFVMEQTAAEASSDEGGLVYAAESLADPDFYASFDAASQSSARATGSISASVAIDFPALSGTAEATVTYEAYDADGVQQSAFGADTRTVHALMSWSHGIGTTLYEGSVVRSAELTLTGLNTDTVTASGSYESQRSVQTAGAYVREFDASIALSASIQNLVLAKDAGSGDFLVAGGSATGSVQGNVNDIAFQSSASWVFSEGGSAEFHYDGDVVSVDVQAGTVEE